MARHSYSWLGGNDSSAFILLPIVFCELVMEKSEDAHKFLTVEELGILHRTRQSERIDDPSSSACILFICG